MIKYFGVVYCTDETTHFTKPKDTKEECMKVLIKMMEDPRVKERLKRTTVIKREMDNFPDGLLFGSPECYNVVK